ncbi:MAG: 2-C-methyl-D-erythritol 4-phosphate cytidylyltransferase [Dehalococcoidia bacterium]|nr:2-C-methyl-D-erythritol 4-phosphate cytidylyltransferase [Dehalococcoidia bacterium]
MSVVAVVVGAGSGVRFGGDKIVALLAGKAVLAHAVAPFEASPRVDGVVVVARAEAIAEVTRIAQAEGWRKVRAIVPGGARRQDSVLAGARAAQAEWVVIHDAARPLLPVAVIDRGLVAAQRTGAAIAALPVRDTIKRVDADGRIVGTVDRSTLWAAQTPQVFRSALLIPALEHAGDVTDDAAAVEAIGGEVTVFLGDEINLKVTTPRDLAVAEALLQAQQGSRALE